MKPLISTKSTKENDKALAIETLKKMLPPDTRVYTKLDHVSSSGMLRVISLYVPSQYGDQLAIDCLNYYAALALDEKLSAKHSGLKVSGAGMDMGYHLVYSLARVLYGDGYALKHSWL
jgi:hypothetical protein